MKVFRGREGFFDRIAPPASKPHFRPCQASLPGLFLDNERDQAMQTRKLPVRCYVGPPVEWSASVLKTGLRHGFTAF